MKKILVLALLVFCVGSVFAAWKDVGTINVAVYGQSGCFKVEVDGFPISGWLPVGWVKSFHWSAPSNVTVAMLYWEEEYPTGDPDIIMYEYGVPVYLNGVTGVTFCIPK
ncbi:MAG: hypothetical protein K8R76_08605 [Candidatus Aegiribacteria sp.]|nr:hypothetical protein [Candidatus Aegiribacteria sp.]